MQDEKFEEQRVLARAEGSVRDLEEQIVQTMNKKGLERAHISTYRLTAPGSRLVEMSMRGHQKTKQRVES